MIGDFYFFINNKEIERRLTNWKEALENGSSYNATQARLHNIDPTNANVLNFNHYFRLATSYLVGFYKKWYHNGATFNQNCNIDDV